MNKKNIIPIIGGVLGYVYFLKDLESDSMGNIIFRNGQFRPSNIIHYMKSPFKERFLWKPNLWSSNWIITTIIGTICGLIITKF